MENSHALEVEAKLFSKQSRDMREQAQNIAPNCKPFSMADRLSSRSSGWYHVFAIDGRIVVSVHRPGLLEEHIFAASPGHANQIRQSLTDEGMAGLVEGAL